MTALLREAIRESGKSFIALEEATGVKRQSLVRFARKEQSLRLDMADRLAAYFGIDLRWKGKTMRIADVLEPVVKPDRIWRWHKIRGLADRPPKGPGLYAWWFDEVPPGVPTEGTTRNGGLRLLYIGISPRRPPGNGTRPSRQTLRSRIRSHYRGKAEGSTLRMTLGCLLADHLGITLQLNESGSRKTFGEGESVLSVWMASHAMVSWIEHPKAWELEEEGIKHISLPLNLQHNQHHVFYPTLRHIRCTALGAARQAWQKRH